MAQKLHPKPGALSRELIRRGLSQADLEAMTGLSRSTLAKINRGESVYERTLGRVGKALAEFEVLEAADAILGLGESA